jgi:AraC-like DNA-binding protein
MEIFNEPIPYQNPALCIKVWRFQDRPIERPASALFGRWHYHKEVEFVLAMDGQHEIHTPNRIYRLAPNDLVVVGSSQVHRASRVSGEKMDIIVLHVDFQPYFDQASMSYYRHFSEVDRPLNELNYIFEEDSEAKAEAANIIVRIHEEMMNKRRGYEIAASMHIKHLMLTLLRGDRKGLLQKHDAVNVEHLRPILEYINARLEEKIELEEVSRLAGMSYHYFSKYFKKSTGLSFTDYVNRKRIAKAERLLASGSRSVTDIAREVGIENMAHFYEMFKRYNGCTPKQYVQKLAGQTAP